MVDKLNSLAQLLKQLQQVPYVASKNIYRVAHYFLEMNEQKLQQFCTALQDAHKNLEKCALCWAWKERTSACVFCSAKGRDQKLICVVETWHDLYAIEKTSGYTGVYHVLGGVICPLEGIGPEDLTIQALVTRITQNPCDEIILAMNQTPEGEATAAFIARKLQDVSCKVTCLARGIPVGSSLESMDRLTVFKALAERRLF